MRVDILPLALNVLHRCFYLFSMCVCMFVRFNFCEEINNCWKHSDSVCYALFAHVNVLKKKTFYTTFCFIFFFSIRFLTSLLFVVVVVVLSRRNLKKKITDELCKCFVACFYA